MTDSILESVKLVCGVVGDDTDFDNELIMHTNTVLGILSQFDVGDGDSLRISGYTEKWSDLFASDDPISLIKDYVGYRVRQIFDPPSGSLANSIDNVIKELEYRISLQVDP